MLQDLEPRPVAEPVEEARGSGKRGHRTIVILDYHRHGVEAASPAAMLSHGNLSTAALSLFVALSFRGLRSAALARL